MLASAHRNDPSQQLIVERGWEGLVRRYFFDLYTSHAIHVDEAGDILPNEDAARDCAWDVIIEHLRSEKGRSGEQISVVVRDAMGPRFNARMTIALEAAACDSPKLPDAIRRLSTKP